MLHPLVLLVAAALAVQAGAWAWLAAGFRRTREQQLDADTPLPAVPLPVSVIVAARDEAACLPALLAALAAQTHRFADGTPAFEVVVVDDGSQDATAAVVREAAEAWAARGGAELHLVSVRPGEAERAGLPRKKYALTRGIAAARHARLAFTDADCVPPPSWLAALAAYAAQDPDGEPRAEPRAEPRLGGDAEGGGDGGAVLVGFSPYARRSGLLGAFVRYETLLTAHQAAAAAGHGHAFHAVGRNLSYPKAVFAQLGGFGAHAASLSGDDDLLVQAAARAGLPARYVVDARAHVPTEAPPPFRAWVRQKRRHASAGRFYDRRALALLALLHGSALVVWAGGPLLHAALGVPWGYGLLAVRLLLQRGALRPAEEAFGARDLTLAQPALDLLYALYQAGLAVLGALPVPKRW
ncbi:MAG: glycosyltransferase [Rubricoccaceae bacterium]